MPPAPRRRRTWKRSLDGKLRSTSPTTYILVRFTGIVARVEKGHVRVELVLQAVEQPAAEQLARGGQREGAALLIDADLAHRSAIAVGALLHQRDALLLVAALHHL